MNLTFNDIDWKSLLIKKYLHYGLEENDVMVLFVSEAVLQMQPKTLLTCDILSPYMKLSEDKIDSSLSNLMSKKIITIVQDNTAFYSSLDAFKEILFKDEIKDLSLKGSYTSNEKRLTEGLYAYLETLNGPLTAIDRDRVSAWLKEGASEMMIKEACKKSVTKGGHISFPQADRLILEMERGQSRKNIGVSTINEQDRKADALRDLIDGSDWSVSSDE